MNKFKKGAFVVLIILSSHIFSQNKIDNKQQIQEIVDKFKNAIPSKNYNSFLTLFAEADKVSWGWFK